MSPELKEFLQEKRLTVTLLSELLEYDPLLGLLKWNVNYRGTIVKGRIAGTKSKGKTGGYICIEINGKAYKAHRLAWAIYYNQMPPENMVVDHKDRVRDNNKIGNLRLITDKQNLQNKTRKHDLPLYVYKHREKFAVRIKTDKMRTYGSFKTVEDALIRRSEILKEFNIHILDAA